MFRILSVFILIVLSPCIYSNQDQSLYQVDLVIYTYPNVFPYGEVSPKPRMLMGAGIPLKISNLDETTNSLYHLLQPASSQLKKETEVLNHDPDYHAILNYSWVQSVSNQKPIIVEKIQINDWSIEGMVVIRKLNYYLFEFDLVFSSDANKTNFSFQQKKYLKADNLYYLDHPQAGILIKIHPILS